MRSRLTKPLGAIFAPAVNRRIRRTGVRLRAEGQALQKEVNEKVHGDYIYMLWI